MDEDLGIIFESAVFDKVIPCTNKCIFCFVDQQPKGLRDSLYVKDDDYRLSYLQGTYITLTNLRPKDKERIENLRLGPLYVSVHTTNPDLRIQMLNNPNAGNVLKELKWLNSLDIPLHTQIVLCPGINEGKELENTLNALGELKSNIMSIAVVPVGITKFREEENLRVFTSDEAAEILKLIENFNQKIGYSLAIPSDELYITAGNKFPENDFYRGFAQLDDGVGSGRLLLDDYKKHKNKLPESVSKPLNITIATGELACKIMQPIIDDLNKIKNLNIKAIPVKNNFWGNKVTVSGLVTGKDLLEVLLPIKEEMDHLVIPSVMLRKLTDQFLDDFTLEDIEDKLDTEITVIEDYYSTEELIEFINNLP